MTSRATLLERNWSRREAGDSLWPSSGELEPVLAELRLAEGLRAAGLSLAQPAWEPAWENLVLGGREPPGMEVRRRGSSASPRLARAGVAVAAGLSLVAGAVIGAAGASPGSLAYPFRKAVERGVMAISPSDQGLLVRVAGARLGDLLTALQGGLFELVGDLAADLVGARQAALEAGGDVSGLDRAIAARVPEALADAPAGVRRTVEAILGDLLPARLVERPRPARPPGEPPVVGVPPGSTPKDEETGGDDDGDDDDSDDPSEDDADDDSEDPGDGDEDDSDDPSEDGPDDDSEDPRDDDAGMG